MHTPEGQILFVLIASTLVAGGLIGYFLYSLFRQFRLYRRQQEGYEKTKLEALEQERQQIAADLHDDIGPMLSATLYKLGEIDPGPEREKTLLVEARRHIDGIFSRLRELSAMLVPRAIEIRGPLHALEEFTETYLSGQPLRVEIRPVNCPGLSAYRSLHLFRMLQEIMHNTLRHARAQHLLVSGQVRNDTLHVQTVDDGVGFDPVKANNSPGLGLQHIAVRARMIGAVVKTVSWPGSGTRYEIELSLTK